MDRWVDEHMVGVREKWAAWWAGQQDQAGTDL